MYYYIIDPQKLGQRQFDRGLGQLYSALSFFRINGEVSRVTPLKTVAQLVDTAILRRATTIVAVGSDDTLHEVINALKGHEVMLGFIPIVASEASKILGVGGIENACKTVALRRVEIIDLGAVNNFLFLTKLSFGPTLDEHPPSIFSFGSVQNLFNFPILEVRFSADNQFTAHLKMVGGIILNGRAGGCGNTTLGNPLDGILDVLLLPKLSKFQTLKYRKQIFSGCYELIPQTSLVHLKKIEISSPEGLALRVGTKIVAKAPAVVEIKPRALRIIVGKERLF